MALTKVSGGILDPGISVAGIVTATGFDGPFVGGSDGINAGIVTATGLDINGNGDISGNLVIGGNLTANGDFTTLNTTLREVELLRVDAAASVAAGIITQTGSGHGLVLADDTTLKMAMDVGSGIATFRALNAGYGNHNGASGIFQQVDLNTAGVTFGNQISVNGATIAIGGNSHRIRSAANDFAIEHTTSSYKGFRFLGNVPENTLVVSNTNSGSVGIGSAIPSAKLDVVGTVKASTGIDASGTSIFRGALQAQDNLEMAGELVHLSDNDTRIRFPANDTISFQTAGSERLRITSDGKVGIGTDNPGSPIEIYGTGAATVMEINGTGRYRGYEIHESGTRKAYFFHDATENEAILNTAEGTLQFAIGDTPVMRLNSSGDLVFKDGVGQGNSLSSKIIVTDSSDNVQYEIGMIATSNEDLYFSNSRNSNIRFRTSGSTRWKIDGDPGHLIPESAGAVNIGSATAEIGNVYIADSKNIFFGSDQDAEIYHNGSSLYMNNSTGNTYIRSGGGQILMRPSSSYDAIVAKTNEVELYYNSQNHSTPKLKTSATGITVGGEVAASQDYPNYRPTLDFNFAAEKKLDPRITYTRTGPASFVNEFGKVVLVGDNTPRFDHDPTTRECKGLLIEESRTNIAPYANDMSQYSGHNFTSTANDAVAPDGTTTATKVEHGGSGTSYLDHINTSVSAAGAGSYTYSVWLKAPDDQPDGYYGCQLAVLYSTGGNVEPTVSLNKTWTRYSVTKTFGASDPGNLRVHIVMFRAAPGSTYGGKVIPSYVWAWGAQIEAGAFATSYIPSAGATRGSDDLVIDGGDFTDFINKPEGTILADYKVIGGHPEIMYISNGNANCRIGLYEAGSSQTRFLVNNLGTLADTTDSAGTTVGDNIKSAGAYKLNDVAASKNGVISSTDSSVTIPDGIDRAYIGGYYNGDVEGILGLRRLVYYQQRLPNSQLVTLTS